MCTLIWRPGHTSRRRANRTLEPTTMLSGAASIEVNRVTAGAGRREPAPGPTRPGAGRRACAASVAPRWYLRTDAPSESQPPADVATIHCQRDNAAWTMRVGRQLAIANVRKPRLGKFRVGPRQYQSIEWKDRSTHFPEGVLAVVRGAYPHACAFDYRLGQMAHAGAPVDSALQHHVALLHRIQP